MRIILGAVKTRGTKLVYAHRYNNGSIDFGFNVPKRWGLYLWVEVKGG